MGKNRGTVPYQHLPQHAGALPIDKLLGAGQLDVHVRVDAHEAAGVFRGTPFQADGYGFVDAVMEGGLTWLGEKRSVGEVDDWEEEIERGGGMAYRDWSIGRGFRGTNWGRC